MQERSFVSAALSFLHEDRGFSHVIAGDEGGAERLGLSWATANEIPSTLVIRQNLRGVRETIDQRNARMLMKSNPELIVAIGAGASTSRLIDSAREIGLRVIKIDVPTNM